MRSTSVMLGSGLLLAAFAGSAVAQNLPPPRGVELAQYYHTQTDQARLLIAEARRAAAAGDFLQAERNLQRADVAAPGFFEVDRARNEIASMRTYRAPARSRDYYAGAIDAALANRQFGEANQLIVDGEMQFPGDPLFRGYRNRLVQMRADTGWSSSDVPSARDRIVRARALIARGDYHRADRELDLAEDAAPGLLEISETRAYLVRVRGMY
jgi:hypothetical protein